MFFTSTAMLGKVELLLAAVGLMTCELPNSPAAVESLLLARPPIPLTASTPQYNAMTHTHIYIYMCMCKYMDPHTHTLLTVGGKTHYTGAGGLKLAVSPQSPL